jgi:hypothetical protein
VYYETSVVCTHVSHSFTSSMFLSAQLNGRCEGRRRMGSAAVPPLFYVLYSNTKSHTRPHTHQRLHQEEASRTRGGRGDDW